MSTCTSIPREEGIGCRDALQHLPCEMGVDALEKLAVAGSRYLLLGSYEQASHNSRIEVGAYYSINLKLPPFQLGDGVLRTFNEHTWQAIGEHDKNMLLISGEFLRSRDFDAMRRGCKALEK